MGAACGENSGLNRDVLKHMEKKHKDKFNPSMVQVVDPYGDMNSIQIKIVAESFKGMLPLARHRAINELLKDEIK